MSDFVNDIIKNSVNQIKYRNTIVNGEITAANSDGTYDVKIANANSAYPSVETILYNETFSIGEIVDIAFEYGNKEAPKIIGHSKKIAQSPVVVEVDYSGESGNPSIIVTTLDAYDITDSTVHFEGKIELSAGANNVNERGFHFGPTTDYGVDTYEDGSYGSGYYNLVESRDIFIDPSTIYHYQAFILDSNWDETAWGVDKTFTTPAAFGWLSPTGFNDPSNIWTNEIKAYDENVGTETESIVPHSSWSGFLELTHSAMTCSKVRFFAMYLADYLETIDIDVFYNGTWHDVYQGTFVDMAWVEKLLPSTQTITAFRFRFYNKHAINAIDAAGLFEVDFYGHI